VHAAVCRLLANLPWYPEAPHDVCQRSFLLRSVGVLDMGFLANFYALKINRFLFWSPSDLAPEKLRSCPGSEYLRQFEVNPELSAVGQFGEERVYEIEWEESVNLVWLLSERPHHEFSDPFNEGVLVYHGQACLLNSRAYPLLRLLAMSRMHCMPRR
jgi:hypothetical protein